MADIALLIGSKSDTPLSDKTIAILEDFGVSYEFAVISAHRQSKKLHEFMNSSSEKSRKIYICIAGLAAHLPGVVASMTPKPVIGVPGDGGPLSGLDALLSIVQMPKGVPVASMAIGSHGARNAALYAIRILALNDTELAKKLNDYIVEMANS